MKNDIPTIVIFILYKNDEYELVSAESYESLSEYIIDEFDKIKRIFEIDVY